MQTRSFQRLIYQHYRQSKRMLPWRETTDPYAILVSEIMLQQTQVDRVIPKFTAWLAQYPTASSLAASSLGEALKLWSGLGYNRRAKFLWQAAQKVVSDFGGKMPSTYEGLLSLPGVGRYTAGAIMAFAYNKPAVVVETNIRAVYIHCFFPDVVKVSDTALMPFIEKTMDRKHPREWFNALMDYGTKLKSEHANPTRKSKHYSKQSRFEGSNRQVRGAILKALANNAAISELDLDEKTKRSVLHDLLTEGLIVKRGAKYLLPE